MPYRVENIVRKGEIACYKPGSVYTNISKDHSQSNSQDINIWKQHKFSLAKPFQI